MVEIMLMQWSQAGPGALQIDGDEAGRGQDLNILKQGPLPQGNPKTRRWARAMGPRLIFGVCSRM